MSKTEINIGGGFCSLLAVAFIVLKLIGEISWKWIWVLSPLWIPTALVIFIVFILASSALILESIIK